MPHTPTDKEPIRRLRADQAGPPLAHHGEGPVWCPADGVLRWVDMLAGDVLVRRHGEADTERVSVGKVAAAVRPRRGGGFVAGVERGFALMEPGSTEVHHACGVVERPRGADERRRLRRPRPRLPIGLARVPRPSGRG